MDMIVYSSAVPCGRFSTVSKEKERKEKRKRKEEREKTDLTVFLRNIMKIDLRSDPRSLLIESIDGVLVFAEVIVIGVVEIDVYRYVVEGRVLTRTLKVLLLPFDALVPPVLPTDLISSLGVDRTRRVEIEQPLRMEFLAVDNLGVERMEDLLRSEAQVYETG